jgi:signal transduction histidine kinase
MLGRQQIAGIPTAIHELFKNAHDAYAERVEVDFFRQNRRLILRDDGYGMTKDDVENRWLTLGTESRVNANRNEDEVWTGPKNLPRRTIMGEKGIGRLAIAVIAPVTLLMTRAARRDGLHDLVVALVHWGLFEQPGLDISSIDVPVIELPGGSLPTDADIRHLVDAVRTNIETLREEIGDDVCQRLIAEVERAKNVSPKDYDATLNEGRGLPLSLQGEGYGTHFILFPVAPELDDDIDGGADNEASKLERNLLGFANTMTGDPPIIITEFRDHNLGEPEEKIGPYSFFTPQEFSEADHQFNGKFDEYGQFVGEVTVYGKKQRFVCNWVEGRGRKTRCGSFSVSFAYVMGLRNETAMTDISWAALSSKLDSIGGIYIYRNNIRALPYGNSDFDFLDIERRRSKSAQDWFFSYRRMFGYVGLSHEENGALSDKAGREGFRENQAYRDFRAILINFIQQLAIEFFRPTGAQSETYWRAKTDFAAQTELLKKEKKKADNRRADFAKELQKFFQFYEAGGFETDVASINRVLEEKLAAVGQIEDDGELAVRIRTLEADVRGQYRSLQNRCSVSRPRGLSLTKPLEKDWAAYERLAAKVRENALVPLLSAIDQALSSAAHGRIGAAQQREAALRILEDHRNDVVREITSLRKESVEESERMQETLQTVLKDEIANLRATIEELLEAFARKSGQQPEAINSLRVEIEGEIRALREREASLLSSIRRQMADIAEGLRLRETNDDRFAALEQRNQVLEEQLDFYTDHAHLGMAVGILQHEFERAAKGLRVAMRDLKPWADKNRGLMDIYKKLRAHFDHLDGYLRVLDPLGRRLQRSTVTLTGEEILNTLWRIFGQSLENEGIQLSATPAFRGKSVECKSSTVIAAFVNVVDNAIYWISHQAENERAIFLDADENGFLIENTGPGIEDRMGERIFDFGETTKPGGRGMGLAVSRDALRREGFDILLVQTGAARHPIFRIKSVGK